MEHAWAIIARRLENQTAAAFRFVEELKQTSPDQLEAHLSAHIPNFADLKLRHTLQATKLAILASQPEGPRVAFPERSIMEKSIQIFEAELERRELEIPLTKVPSSEKLNAYGDLQERFSALQQSMRPDQAKANFSSFEALLPELDTALQMEPIDYLQQDLEQLYVDCLGNIGTSYAALFDREKTREYYEAAIARAQLNDLPQSVNRYKIKLVDFLFTQSEDYNYGLAEFLPQLIALQTDSPSLTRVDLCIRFANAYLKVEDWVGAQEMKSQLLMDLPALGFAIPNLDQLEESFAQWVSRADKVAKDTNQFLANLKTVIMAYIGVAHLDSHLASSPAGKDKALKKMQALKNLDLQMEERIAALEMQDNAYLESRFSQNPSPMEDGFSAYQRESDAFFLAFEALHNRFQTGEKNAVLLREVEDLEKEAQRLGSSQHASMLVHLQAKIRFATGENEQAYLLSKQAIAESLAEDRYEDALYFYDDLLQTYAAGGKQEAIAAHVAKAIDIVEQYRYHLGPSYQQNAFIGGKVSFYQLGVFAAWKAEDYDLLLHRMSLAKASASMRLFLAGQNASERADGQEIRKEIEALDIQIQAASGKEIEALQEKRSQLFALLATQSTIKQALPKPSLRKIQNSLSEEEAVCTYFWLAEEVLLIIGISKDAFKISRQIFDGASLAALQTLLSQIGESNGRVGLDQALIDRMGILLLPEEIFQVIGAKKRLRISPHQILHLFPFHAVKREGYYLFESFACSYFPNLSALLTERSENRKQKTLAMGVEKFQLPHYNLTSLPGAWQEVHELQKIYPEDNLAVRLNEAVRIEEIRQLAKVGKLSSYDTIHLALHGENASQNAKNPMETRLFLQNGAIDGLEISQWELNADLVILSACHSGKRGQRGRSGSEGIAADEVFGLQAAFFGAGARQILGALWPASDLATQKIMLAFHRYYQSMEADFALQAAMKAYLAEDHTEDKPSMTRNLFAEDNPFEPVKTSKTNPVFWAPFFLTFIGR
ncbi:MAG: CHAT domain-containing protein [Bacteroidota bacterium]